MTDKLKPFGAMFSKKQCEDLSEKIIQRNNKPVINVDTIGDK